MAFLDNLGRKLSEVGQTVKEKSGEFIEKSGELIEINKLKAEIRSEKGKIQKLYLEVGQQAYSIYEAEGDYAGLLPLMEQVNESNGKIDELKAQIEAIKVENPDIADDADDDAEDDV